MAYGSFKSGAGIGINASQGQYGVKPQMEPRYAGISDYLFGSSSGGQFGLAPSLMNTAKDVAGSKTFKAAKLGYEVAGKNQMQPMAVDENEIMDPETMALMRMGGKKR
jgi:hypothetical protein